MTRGMLLPSGITPYPNPLPDGHAYRIPAPWGYLNVLRGATDGSSGLRTINAKDCDGTATTTAPRAPAFRDRATASRARGATRRGNDTVDLDLTVVPLRPVAVPAISRF